MVGQAFEAESGEMNQTGLRESLARESMVDASRLIALSGSLEGIGLGASRRFIPEVAPAILKPSRELRAPLRVLGGIGVKIADHKGATGALLAHPWLELIEGFTFHALCWHVDGRDGHALDATAHPVVLELITLPAEALVSLQLELTIDPHVTLAAMKGSPRAVLVAGRCQALLIILLAALEEFGQDDDVGPPTNS